ncbi:VIT1/CCC1 transporter family protein [Sphingobium yanoikuyae]|uniref:VIT1/CCC1 transporter family protein n=1 Tax=Sphingobium yanoikuyae TaxID=13690 RepID=UPI003AF68FC6
MIHLRAIRSERCAASDRNTCARWSESALPASLTVTGEALGSLLFLALLGWVGAAAGGANPLKPVGRVVFWGALAMGLTAGIGSLVGKAI